MLRFCFSRNSGPFLLNGKSKSKIVSVIKVKFLLQQEKRDGEREKMYLRALEVVIERHFGFYYAFLSSKTFCALRAIICFIGKTSTEIATCHGVGE